MSSASPTTEHQWQRISRDFVEIRERTARILQMLEPEAYTEQGVWERYPPVFFDGHIDAFVQTRIFRDLLGDKSFRPDLDDLFFRGMAPLTPEESQQSQPPRWPPPQEIHDYKERVRTRLFKLLSGGDLSNATHPLVSSGRAFIASLEHECMHQESILFVIHRLPSHRKRRLNPEAPPAAAAPAPALQNLQIPDGVARLGAREGEFPFAWDNEIPCHDVSVPGFTIESLNVTNRRFLEFIAEGGYRRKEFWSPKTWEWRSSIDREHPTGWIPRGRDWRYEGFFEEHDLPLDWPAYVTHAEAEAFARFHKASLPTEAQWHRAAFGDDHDRPYPWGHDLPEIRHGNFDFTHDTPRVVGSSPEGAGLSGALDLSGNGWEWTSTLLEGFPGFQPMELYPQYTADFIDGEHYVLKGASPFTARQLLRRSFRTWYRWDYRYPYSSFRLARNSS